MLFLEKIKQKIFNEKVKTNKQIETETSLKTIVEIPLKNNTNLIELIAHEKEKTVVFKAFKKLITNIQFLCVNNVSDKKVMLVTSPENNTGKSYVVANMAIGFAEIGKKVLIIDADMFAGRQDKIFNIPNNLGLSNYLSGLDSNGVEINEFLSKFINETAIKNINLITAGTVPPNPAELLASSKLPELIKDAKVFFDVILIDSSEVLNKTEALILTRNVNSTIIVVEKGKTAIEDLENAKKDIQNVGGKILGVVLNKVKLPKEKKSKAQRKEDFIKFKLKIKEKINFAIEKIKIRINKINQKLLEEAKEQKAIETNKIVGNEKIDEISSDLNNIKSASNLKNEIIENDTNKKISFSEILKNIKLPEKKEDNNNLEDKIESKITESKIAENKFEDNINEYIKKENKDNAELELEEKIDDTIIEEQIEEESNIIMQQLQMADIEQQNQEGNLAEEKENSENNVSIVLKIKKSVLEKFELIKSKFIENKPIKEQKDNENKAKATIHKYVEITKEKASALYSNCKEFCIKKYNYFKDINKKSEKENNINKEKIESKENLDNLEKVENKETEITSEKKEILDDSIKNEKMLLIIVDAENGYCRIFSKEYFGEKLVRGLDKNAGYVKAHYSMKNLRRKEQYFIERYQITEAQAKRIDPLIYDILKDYDEYQWLERKIPSDKAENYVLALSKEFEKEAEEAEKQYNVRCQRLRKSELEKSELDIEYKLDNLWKTTKLNVFDKVQLNRLAKFYEIEATMKNDSEIIKSKKTKKFYTDIITGAEERLEKANKEDREKEESEKQVIEEDKKIKQEELKFEQQQFELEKRAAQERIRLEQENIRAEKKAEQDRIKEEKRKEREIERIEKKEESLRRRKEKQKQKEEAKFQKEREKVKQREEAKIEEELLVDNLYPKTKHNKNL